MYNRFTLSLLYLENPCDSGQKWKREHHVEGLGCQQDFSQILRWGVRQRVSGHSVTSGGSAAAWRPLRSSREFVTNIFGDSLCVGDGQEAVLLVGALKNFGCSLVSSR